MPGIKLKLPENFFNTSINIPVRITDINYGNHVGNDSLISIIHEARMQFLGFYGLTEMNIDGAGLLGLIMSDISVEFKNESFYNDIIRVRIAKGDISEVRFELYYQLSTIRNDIELLIAKAKTTMVCYNYNVKKVSPIPDKLLKILI